jgi:glycosyltransferase involved in cell wall biosynthesis
MSTMNNMSTMNKTKPWRVMFVHDSNAFGGMEVHILLLLRYLDRTRYTPSVMVPGYTEPYWSSPQRLIDEVQALGVPLVRPPHPGHIRGVSFLRDVNNIRRLFMANRTEVVHIHTSQPERARKVTLGAALARVPVVVRTEHRPPSAANISTFLKYSCKLFDQLTDRIVVVSEDSRTEQIKLLNRVRHKLYRSYNGIELDRFRSTGDIVAAKRHIGLDPKRKLIGAVGRLSEEKGHKYLIRAMPEIIQEHGPVNLILVGDGPLESAIRSLITQLDLENVVHLAGYQPDPLRYIDAMDIAVLPSLYEGLPLTLLEYMAMGKPTVVTDCPSFAEALGSEDTALMVPRKSDKGLAQGILELLRHPARSAEMGQAAQKHVQNEFSIQRNVADIMNLYDTLLDGDRQTSSRMKSIQSV